MLSRGKWLTLKINFLGFHKKLRRLRRRISYGVSVCYFSFRFGLTDDFGWVKLYKVKFGLVGMKRSSRRWKKKGQMRWKWQRKRLKKEKRKRKMKRNK